MRTISFRYTERQIRERTKTVTRRTAWTGLKPGTVLQPVKQCQGLKKGEHVEKIGGPIRVVLVSRERLNVLLDNVERSYVEVIREGFEDLEPQEFVDWFCRNEGIRPSDRVTRIEFEYV